MASITTDIPGKGSQKEQERQRMPAGTDMTSSGAHPSANAGNPGISDSDR